MKAVLSNKIVEFAGTDSIHHLINLRSRNLSAYRPIRLSKNDRLRSDRDFIFVISETIHASLEESSGWNELIFVSPEESSEFSKHYDLENSTTEFYGRQYYSNGGLFPNSPYLAIAYETDELYWYEKSVGDCGYYDMAVIDGRYKMFFPVWEQVYQFHIEEVEAS